MQSKPEPTLALNPDYKALDKALEQSKRLSNVLPLALGAKDEAVHASIVREAYYSGRDGIQAMAQPILHFKMTNAGNKADELITRRNSMVRVRNSGRGL